MHLIAGKIRKEKAITYNTIAIKMEEIEVPCFSRA